MNRQQMAYKKHAGFTLIELLIGFVIVAVVITTAIPAVQQMIRNGQVKSVSNQAYAWMSLARSEAIKRGTVVSLSGKDSCDDFLSCGPQIFVDCDADGTFTSGTTCNALTRRFYTRR